MSRVIVQSGDAILRQIAKPVAESEFGSKEFARLIEEMLEILDSERDGVALAAPQIGIGKRIFVVRYDRLHPHLEDSSAPPPEAGVYINPEFTKTSRRRIEMEEGCLSVRRIYGKALRHERATVRARLPDGTAFERGGGGILAQIFQHEIDHLNGILFIDHATDLVEFSPEEYEKQRERHTHA